MSAGDIRTSLVGAVRNMPDVSMEHFIPTNMDRRTQVAVSADVPPKRVVFLAGDGVAVIVFDYETFMAAYREQADWVYKHAHPKYRHEYNYEDLIRAMREKAICSNDVDIGWLARQSGVPLDFCFNCVLYSAVDKGEICLYDMLNKCYVDSYILRVHGQQSGPLAGAGHLEYMLPSGKIFLKGGWVS